MDRFIVFTRIDFANTDVTLKSNMDRFIDTLKITPNDLIIL
jgi:hypothetical protein